MNMLKNIVTGVGIAASIFTQLDARTSYFQFSKEVSNVELWTAIMESDSGATELEAMSANWTNQIVIKNNAASTLNLVLTENYSDSYPYPEGQAATPVNFIFEGNSIKLTVDSGGTLGLRTQTKAQDFSNETACGSIELRSAAELIVQGTGRVFSSDLSMNQYTNSDKLVEIRDQAYFFTRGTTSIGSTNAGGVQALRLVGSQIQQAHVRNLTFTGAEGTSVENVKGAKLEFLADADGITTVQNESAVVDFSGVVLVDFSDLIWDESWGDEHQFTLVSSTGSSSGAFEYFCENQDTLADVNGVSDWLFSYDNYNLYLTVSQVPEPATYAAIFGALALAFAAYRRRK